MVCWFNGWIDGWMNEWMHRLVGGIMVCVCALWTGWID